MKLLHLNAMVYHILISVNGFYKNSFHLQLGSECRWTHLFDLEVRCYL